MFHKIQLLGRLGGDPEMRFTAEGTPVTNFNVAVNNVYTKNGGEKVEETIWVRVSVWRRQAETCNEYLSKGSQVYVEGTLNLSPKPGSDDPLKPVLEPRVWEDNAGNARASVEVTGRFVKFLGGGGGPAPSGGPGEAEEESIPF